MSSTQLKIAVVFNPNSKKNLRDPDRFEVLEAIVGPHGSVVRTDQPEAVVELVRGFLDAKIPYLVADGGDGAFHWLVNAAYVAVRERGLGERVPAILPTNSGTIDFMARKAGVIGKPQPLLRTLVKLVKDGDHPEIVAIDSLRLRGAIRPSGGDEQPFEKIGFAMALAGVGSRFFQLFYDQEQKNAIGVLSTVGKILGSASLGAPGLNLLPFSDDVRSYGGHVFEPMPLDVWVDGDKLQIAKYRALNCGSIDLNLAGVFRLFPHAKEQGVMHVQAGNPSVFEVAKALPVMFAGGKKLPVKEFVECPARHLRVETTSELRMNPVIDGEIFEDMTRCEVSRGPQVDVIRLVADPLA